MRTHWIFATCALIALLCTSALADPAADKPQGKQDEPSSKSIAGHANQVRGDEITPECKAAIEKGIAWLAQQQSNDGGFAGTGYGYSRNVAMTALAGLAFMEHGDLPGRGKYG